MRPRLCGVIGLLAILAMAMPAAAQAPPRLAACVSTNGFFYNVRPEGMLTEPCSGQDPLVFLGSGTIDGITAGRGLVGGGVSGNVRLDLDPIAVPPACAPGEVLVSNAQGVWSCAAASSLRANPAGQLWVLPRLDFCNRDESGSGPFGDRVPLPGACGRQTLITIVNPGVETVRGSCLYFDAAGRFLLIPDLRGFTLSPGAQAVCGVPDASEAGWSGMGLVVSDRDVLVTAYVEGSRAEGSRNFQVEAYPIDCRSAAGYEFVCRFARE